MSINIRFKIGQQYTTKHGKATRLHTIVDILRTYNDKGGLVKVCYVATHELMGQAIVDHEVCDTTIARALWNDHYHGAQKYAADYKVMRKAGNVKDALPLLASIEAMIKRYDLNRALVWGEDDPANLI